MGGGEGVIANGEGECWIEYRVQSTEDGKMAVQRCKAERSSCAKVERWGPKKITDYGVRRTEDGKMAVQRCKSERSSGGKVERWMTIRVQSAGSSTEYRLRSTEDGKMAVQRWKSAYGLCKGGKVDDKTGRVGTAYRHRGILR